MSTTARRPYHHGNLRSALLEQAERTLSEQGVAGLSLRELAREVGVSHAAPRRHFKDRQALLDALAEDGFERLGEVTQAAVDGAGRSFRKRLTALARTYVHFATEHAALLELMFAAKHREGATENLREAGERAFVTPLNLIAEGQESGEVARGDCEHVAMVVFATLQGLASLLNVGMLADVDPDEIVGEAVDRLLTGLRPR
jgi:AcrR family transcriptional regulator